MFWLPWFMWTSDLFDKVWCNILVFLRLSFLHANLVWTLTEPVLWSYVSHSWGNNWSCFFDICGKELVHCDEPVSAFKAIGCKNILFMHKFWFCFIQWTEFSITFKFVCPFLNKNIEQGIFPAIIWSYSDTAIPKVRPQARYGPRRIPIQPASFFGNI